MGLLFERNPSLFDTTFFDLNTPKPVTLITFYNRDLGFFAQPPGSIL